MRPNNQNKNRQRSRNGGRKHVNPLSRNFESNGPDVKVRGNAAHIAEKYLQLARDAQSSGDSVMAENYLQHAEHYFRIVASAQQAQNGQRPDGQSQDDDFDDDMPEMNSRFASPQPMQQPSQQGDGDEQSEGDRSEQPQQPQQGERNNDRGDRQRRDRQERPRQERPRQERPAEQQEQPQIAAAAAEPIAESESEASAEQQAEGEARKPRRPRRRRPAGGDAGDPAGAPQPDVGELPAFLTGKAATAAE